MKLFTCALLACVFSASAHATEVKEVVSPSGIKAWLVEEHTLPLVAVRVVFTDSGFAHDPAGKEGLANLTTGLLMEGAGEMDSKAFNEALESRAIQMNVDTDEDKIEASMESLSEHLPDAFSYLSAALSSPRFDESAIERVRGQAVSLIAQQEEKPGYKAHLAWQKLAFGDHGYAHPSLGNAASLKNIERSDLKDFSTRHLTRENMLIAVSGDITPEALSALLEKSFTTLPQHFNPAVSVPEVTLPSQGKTTVIDSAIPQTMVIFGTRGVKRSDPNYFAAYVMNHILGGGTLSSKLITEIREKRGLSYSVSSANDPMEHSAVWRGGFSTRNEKASEALETLVATIKDFVQKGPTAKELEDAKEYLTGSFVLSLDSNASITSFLISMQENHLGRDYFNTRNQLVNAVTREDVMTMANRLIDPDNLLIVLVGKPNLAEKKP